MVDPDLIVREVVATKSTILPRSTGYSTHLLPHLSPNMRQPLLAVEAHRFKTTVSEHLDHLSVLLSILTENQLALVVVVLVLSTSPVFTTLNVR